MKVKRTISIILLSFAITLFMAHSFIPHCHLDGAFLLHQSETFAENSQTESHECSDHSCVESEDTGHNHNCSNLNNCNLDTVIFRTVNIQHDLLHIVCCLSVFYYSDYLLRSLYPIESDLALKIRLKPYIDHYYTPFLGSTKALRAPPASLLS